MRRLIAVVLSFMFMIGLSGLAIAGSMDSPGAPSSGSGMYTLQNLYDYLNSGTAAPTPGPFQEPGAAPSSTMKTISQIYDDIKAKFNECDATPDKVFQGTKFFSTQPGSWGVRTGTFVLPPTATPTTTPTSTSTPTPTWNPTACVAKGGKWLATEFPAPDDSGCWFLASGGSTSCTTVCNSYGLGCSVKFNTDAQCTQCKAFKPGAACNTSGCTVGICPYWYSGGNTCYYRTSGPKECGYISNPPDVPLCVCLPN
ncbi:MAG: hypothetical protein NTZ78_13300 [Candidatus Aureabacteria bacterium]|nr:hypothetical protein [Candidatus Auribacterota bacterium]